MQVARRGEVSVEAISALHAIAGCLQRLGRSEEAEAAWVQALTLIDQQQQLLQKPGIASRQLLLYQQDSGREGGGGGLMGSGDSAAGTAACSVDKASLVVPSSAAAAAAHGVVVMSVLQSLAGCRYGAGRLSEVRPRLSRAQWKFMSQ